MTSGVSLGTTTTTAAAANATASTSKASGFASGDFETFLKMLTTQISNQDPLNPMESADFSTQLATFSGVEQQARTNELLEAMAGGGASGLAQYADWIGKEARSTAAVMFKDQPVTLEIAPDAQADQVVLVARDSFGRVASSEPIGTAAGQVDWFGRNAEEEKLADGLYTFEIENWKGGEKLSTTKVESYARITEAETGPKGVTLVTDGGVKVEASAVTGLRSAG